MKDRLAKLLKVAANRDYDLVRLYLLLYDQTNQKQKQQIEKAVQYFEKKYSI